MVGEDLGENVIDGIEERFANLVENTGLFSEFFHDYFMQTRLEKFGELFKEREIALEEWGRIFDYFLEKIIEGVDFANSKTVKKVLQNGPAGVNSLLPEDQEYDDEETEETVEKIAAALAQDFGEEFGLLRDAHANHMAARKLLGEIRMLKTRIARRGISEAEARELTSLQSSLLRRYMDIQSRNRETKNVVLRHKKLRPFFDNCDFRSDLINITRPKTERLV